MPCPNTTQLARTKRSQREARRRYFTFLLAPRAKLPTARTWRPPRALREAAAQAKKSPPTPAARPAKPQRISTLRCAFHPLKPFACTAQATRATPSLSPLPRVASPLPEPIFPRPHPNCLHLRPFGIRRTAPLLTVSPPSPSTTRRHSSRFNARASPAAEEVFANVVAHLADQMNAQLAAQIAAFSALTLLLAKMRAALQQSQPAPSHPPSRRASLTSSRLPSR